MILVVATRNDGKLREWRELLGDVGVELRSLADFPDAPEVAETGDTYLANACAKAVAVARCTGLPALADDSGLEVDALGGAPGVRSARFAADAGHSERTTNDERRTTQADAANIALLLDRLAATPDAERGARFRCVAVVARPDGREIVAEGVCEGAITREPRGRGGFGYDPVFYYPPLAATFGELPAPDKQRISHRARAAAALRERLREFLS